MWRFSIRRRRNRTSLITRMTLVAMRVGMTVSCDLPPGVIDYHYLKIALPQNMVGIKLDIQKLKCMQE